MVARQRVSQPESTERRHFLTGACAAVFLSSAPASARRASFAAVVSKLASLIDREYPDPALAHSISVGIRQRLRDGRYGTSNPQELASFLTADLRSLGHDQHLAVSYAPKEAELRIPAETRPTSVPVQPSPKVPSAKARAIFEPHGYGIVKAELLAGNIGLLQIDNFVPLYDLVRERIAHAMDLLSDSWGMILDLRTNGGGTSDTPAYLVSYFFDRPPFVLNRMVWRNQPEETIKTTRDLIGGTYGEKRPLVIATSTETFSAAEAIAYSLQSTKRATIVGERTRGGANPGDFFNLGQGFQAFCPQGRAIDTVTGKNWEGTGVQPDIVTASSQTLATSHRIVVERALKLTTEPDNIEILQEALKSGPFKAAA